MKTFSKVDLEKVQYLVRVCNKVEKIVFCILLLIKGKKPLNLAEMRKDLNDSKKFLRQVIHIEPTNIVAKKTD